MDLIHQMKENGTMRKRKSDLKDTNTMKAKKKKMGKCYAMQKEIKSFIDYSNRQREF